MGTPQDQRFRDALALRRQQIRGKSASKMPKLRDLVVAAVVLVAVGVAIVVGQIAADAGADLVMRPLAALAAGASVFALGLAMLHAQAVLAFLALPPVKLYIEVFAAAAVIATVAGIGLGYLQLRDARISLDEERAERQRAHLINAWQIIAAGPSAGGNVGQKAAFQLLRDHGADLRNINLSFAVLDRIDLSDRNLTGAKFRDSDLARATLRDANLSGADLRGARLVDADLADALFYEADLRGADLSRTNLRDAFFNHANLQGADLLAADMQRAEFLNADLRGALIRLADLRNAYFRNADIRGANLFAADMRETDLRDADMRGADLAHVDLRGAENIPDLSVACFSARGESGGPSRLPPEFPEDRKPWPETDEKPCPQPVDVKEPTEASDTAERSG